MVIKKIIASEITNPILDKYHIAKKELFDYFDYDSIKEEWFLNRNKSIIIKNNDMDNMMFDMLRLGIDPVQNILIEINK